MSCDEKCENLFAPSSLAKLLCVLPIEGLFAIAYGFAQGLLFVIRGLSSYMDRKLTGGGKKKYKFEPKVELHDYEPFDIDAGYTAEVALESHKSGQPAIAPAQKRNAPKQVIQALEPSTRSHTVVETNAQDMVFRQNNDPQCIQVPDRIPLPFHRDMYFVMELPDIEDAEFIVYTDGTCAVTNNNETVVMRPFVGSSQIAVEIVGDTMSEFGVVTQSYAADHATLKRHSPGTCIPHKDVSDCST